LSAESIQVNTEVETLLTEAGLPVSDLRGIRSLNLFGIRRSGCLIGVVGVEVYGAVGLLRSLAVAAAHRSGGCGLALESHVEAWASQQGVKTLYLLTTTAASYFERLGYERITRSEAPAVISATAQFAVLCPSSSIFMRKLLAANAPTQIANKRKIRH
jgi:amino-acid N-acetyltransferase